MAEQVLLLENIGTSLKVGPNQLVSLHKLLLQAATILQMDHTPDLYVRQVSPPILLQMLVIASLAANQSTYLCLLCKYGGTSQSPYPWGALA